MIIDLKKLRQSGKASVDFFFEYVPESGLIDIPGVEITPPVKISGSAILTGDHSVYLKGEIAYTLKGNCTRCLKETERRFVTEFDLEAADGGDVPVVNDKVDVSAIADEEIILSSPINFLCDENCAGIDINENV